MQETLEHGRVPVQQLIQNGVSASDPRVAQAKSACDQIINRPFEVNTPCTLQSAGTTIQTFCDQSYAQSGMGGSVVPMSVEQAVAASVAGQQVQVGQFEREDAKARRLQMEAAGLPANQVIAPNFDCSKAHTQREITICNSYALADLDHTYGQYWSKAEPLDKKHKVKKEIVRLYREGEQCGSSADCIHDKLVEGIDYLAAFLKEGGIQVASYEDIQAEKQKEAAEAKAQAEQEQSRREAEEQAKQKADEELQRAAAAKAEQERQEREADQERQLALAQAEADKAKAEAEKAKALAAVEAAKAKATAEADAEKGKAAAAVEKARADADRATAEAEKAKVAQEEEARKNSWSYKIAHFFSSSDKPATDPAGDSAAPQSPGADQEPSHPASPRVEASEFESRNEAPKSESPPTTKPSHLSPQPGDYVINYDLTGAMFMGETNNGTPISRVFLEMEDRMVFLAGEFVYGFANSARSYQVLIGDNEPRIICQQNSKQARLHAMDVAQSKGSYAIRGRFLDYNGQQLTLVDCQLEKKDNAKHDRDSDVN